MLSGRIGGLRASTCRIPHGRRPLVASTTTPSETNVLSLVTDPAPEDNQGLDTHKGRDLVACPVDKVIVRARRAYSFVRPR
jgi:hypothetical protein